MSCRTSCCAKCRGTVCTRHACTHLIEVFRSTVELLLLLKHVLARPNSNTRLSSVLVDAISFKHRKLCISGTQRVCASIAPVLIGRANSKGAARQASVRRSQRDLCEAAPHSRVRTLPTCAQHPRCSALTYFDKVGRNASKKRCNLAISQLACSGFQFAVVVSASAWRLLYHFTVCFDAALQCCNSQGLIFRNLIAGTCT